MECRKRGRPAEGHRRARAGRPARRAASAACRVAGPVEVGHHGQVAALGDRGEQRVSALRRRSPTPSSRPPRGRAPRPRRRRSAAASGSGCRLLEQPARCASLAAPHVRLVERVDAEHAARRPRSAYSQARNCAPSGPLTPVPCVRRRRRRCATTCTSAAGARCSGASGASTTTGSRPRPCLPVDSAISCSTQSPKPDVEVGDRPACRDLSRRPAAERGAERERRRRRGRPAWRRSAAASSSSALDVGAGQRATGPARRRSARCSGRRRPGRPGRPRGSPRRSASLRQRRARVGDDDDRGWPASMPGGGRRRREQRAALAVGLDACRRTCSTPRRRCASRSARAPAATWSGVGGVEHDQRHAGRSAQMTSGASEEPPMPQSTTAVDALGRAARRAAGPGRARSARTGLDGVEPAQPDLGLGGRLRAPQRRVLPASASASPSARPRPAPPRASSSDRPVRTVRPQRPGRRRAGGGRGAVGVTDGRTDAVAQRLRDVLGPVGRSSRSSATPPPGRRPAGLVAPAGMTSAPAFSSCSVTESMSSSQACSNFSTPSSSSTCTTSS